MSFTEGIAHVGQRVSGRDHIHTTRCHRPRLPPVEAKMRTIATKVAAPTNVVWPASYKKLEIVVAEARSLAKISIRVWAPGMWGNATCAKASKKVAPRWPEGGGTSAEDAAVEVAGCRAHPCPQTRAAHDLERRNVVEWLARATIERMQRRRRKCTDARR